MMVRLARKPSLWMCFCGRLLFAIVWAGVFFSLSTWVWLHRFGTPTFILVILGIFDVIAIAVVRDIVVRFRHKLHQHEPVVEIDRESPTYGDSVELHIVDTHPESICEMDVKLVGECYNKSDLDFTEHHETVISRTRCYEEELLRLKPAANEPINRTVRMNLPRSAPAEGVAWKIIVDSYLRQGGMIEHPFPIRVRESA
jgi:hypothetical protein